MNLTQMANFVRAQVDADSDDAPLNSLEFYARDAYRNIIRRRVAWPHKYAETTLELQPNVQEYPLSSLGAGNIEVVTAVISNEYGYIPIMSRPDSIDRFGFEDVPRSGAQFVVVGPSRIWFYPVPIRPERFRILGYSRFADWPTQGETPDLPEEFHQAICWAMCRDYFLSQEEPEMAQIYNVRFENDVQNLISRLGQSFGSYASPTYFTGSRRSLFGRRRK
jgi:hypothetical protein